MGGTLRMMLAIAVLIAAGYGIYFLWTGTLPPHTLKVAGSYGHSDADRFHHHADHQAGGRETLS